jgi:hypothetical protein
MSTGCFRANDETIDSTGLQEQCLSTWCPLGAGLTNNEDLLDEYGTFLPFFSSRTHEILM